MKDFINKLDELNLFIIEENGSLVLKKYKNRTDNKQASFEASKHEIIAFIKANKEALLAHLKEEKIKEKQSSSRDRIYKLSPLQEGLLFHGLYNPEATAYTVQFSLDFLQEINVEALKAAWEYVLNNHSILRTAFFHEEFKIPVQRVFENVSLPFIRLDYSSYKEKEQEEALEAFMKSDHQNGFQFNEAPLLRVTMIKRSKTSYRMVLTFHHILLDGWSVSVLFTELLQAYHALEKGQKLPVKEEDVYEDYIKYIAGKDKNTEENFWKNYIQGIETPTLLPFTETVNSVNKTKGESGESTLLIDHFLAEKIRSYARKNHVTVNSILQGVWAFLLTKYTGNKDVVYGVTVSGRPTDLKDSEDRVGLFINTLPLRTRLEDEMQVADWLLQLQSEHTACREYQYTNLATIQSFCEVKEELFDSILVFENYPISEALSEVDNALSIGNMDDKEQTNYPLAIVASLGDKLEIKFNYNADLLSVSSICSIQEHFKTVLEQLILPDQRIADLTILTKEETHKLLHTFNATEITYPKNQSIVDIFRVQVEKNASKKALVFENEEMTYQELEDSSNQIADYLQKQGVMPGEKVGILSRRNMDMIASILGILKAGGAYVPLDPTLPLGRLKHIVADAALTYIVCNDYAMSLDIGITGAKFLDTNILNSYTKEAKEIAYQKEAYVMYTSGTTGLPKGIEITQHNILKLVYDANPIQVSASDHVLQWSNYAFDGSVYEIFSSLLKGATLFLIKEEVASDGLRLSETIKHYQITKCFVTTALFNAMVDCGIETVSCLKSLLFGGEMVSVGHVQKALSILGAGKLIHVYGPTETTVYATYYSVDSIDEIKDTVPIGYPLSNTSVYVMDTQQKMVPVGAVGELCIGGEGLAKGYLQRAALTAEKFLENPYLKGRKIYRTGDLAKWLPNGSIEFIGRKDAQVKVRGYRIELGEIESAIAAREEVIECRVLVHEDGTKNKRLIAYVAVQGELKSTDIEAEIRTTLPEYMIPDVWMQVDKIPLNSNGKLNKKALPEPAFATISQQSYVAPASELEISLAAIWSELLSIEKIGMFDNFFDLGGHSLLATRLVAMIRKAMDTEIMIKDIFVFPTLAEQVKFITAEKRTPVLPEITVQERVERSPLSFSQERLWFLDQLQGSLEYHIPGIIQLSGDLDMEALEKSLRAIVTRHQILHTVIRSEKGVAYQSLIPADQWELHKKVLTSKERIEEVLEQDIKTPFNLSEDYMLRATLYTLKEGSYVLGFILHHIAGDGWSNSILIKDLMELYQKYHQDSSYIPKIPELQYRDYAIWQRSFLSEKQLEDQLTYWETKLKEVSPLKLPLDYSRPVELTTAGFTVAGRINKEITKKLRNISKQEGVTLFMTLLASFKVILHKYSGQEDICVGTPIANRLQQELEEMIGFFVNTLALRTSIQETTTFKNVLQEVKKTTLEAYDHQLVPFEKIVDKVIKVRDMSMSPLFQVMFVLQNLPETKEVPLEGIMVTPYDFTENTSHFDITLTVNETDNDELLISFVSKSELFTKETIQQIAAHYQEFLKQIVIDIEVPVGKVDILKEEERYQLLEEFNATKKSYPLTTSFVDLFEEQVSLHPEQYAVVTVEEQISYKEIDEQSNQLANYLNKQGVAAGDLIGVCISRSSNLLRTILGVLKSGATYVPIDPEYPSERIQHIIDDAQLHWVVKTSEILLRDCHDKEVEYIDLDTVIQSVAGEPKEREKTEHFNAEAIAYVIYTSGSTGKPKGVKIKHRSLINLCCWHKEVYKVNATSRATLFSAIGFDASIWEIFPYLMSGATLYPITEDEVRYDIEALIHFLQTHEITHAYIPSQLCQRIVQKEIEIEGITILTGGEALQLPKSTKLNIYNNYGPTEDTVVSTYYKVTGQDIGEIAIGSPIANTEVYVLDKEKKLVPIGVEGELYVSGEGVAAGYLHQETLTKERFIQNPFRPGTIMYATGDIVKWRTDGALHFSGRKDEQVKIRGHRIELGEIENVLQQYTSGLQLVVTVQEDTNKNKRLIGYWVNDIQLDKEELIKFAKSKLPDYMVPVIWIPIDELPITENGKVAKKRLPVPDFSALQTTYTPPKNDTEQLLCEIWEALLHLDTVGTTDDFFQVGGHSLLAARLMAAIRDKTKAEITVKDIFRFPTVETLASHILNQKAVDNSIPIEKITDNLDKIPLSFSQERLWFLDQLEGSTAYHMPTVFSLQGILDIQLLEKAFYTVMERHQALRTVIKSNDGIGYQEIKPWESWKLQYEQITNESELKSAISEFIVRPFNLSDDYMMRAVVFQKSETSYVLGIVIHHISGDGWSNGILQKELIQAYNQYQSGKERILDPLPIQYTDYAVWQRKKLSHNVLESQLSYWEEKLRGTPPLLLPTDFDRPAMPTTSGAIFSYELTGNIRKQLAVLTKNEGSTVFMTLLAGFKVLLYKYSGQNDICVGTPMANRTHSELEEIIGFFANTLALRSDVRGTTSFSDLVQQVKNTTLDAYTHQDTPFEKVVDRVVDTRDRSISPLFQVLFVLQNTPEEESDMMEGVSLNIYEVEEVFSQFDLTITANESEKGISLDVIYNPDLFKEARIERMMQHYEKLLSQVLEAPETFIKDINIITEEEKKQLLTTFNNTAVPFPEEKNLVTAFRKQALLSADRIAVVGEKEKLSYHTLDKQSDQLAMYLLEKGVTRETLICICTARSTTMIVSILGILKAGAAYVPIDPSYPLERVQYILEDTKATILVKDSTCPDIVLENIQQLAIDQDWEMVMNTPVKKLPAPESAQLAYVIYTSGSTGKPKGVMIEHQSIMNTIYAQIEDFEIHKEDHCLQFASQAFDASVSEIFITLIKGATLYIIDEGTKSDIQSFVAYIVSNQIDWATLPPAFFRLLETEDIQSLRTIVTAGEQAAFEKAKAYAQVGQFINAYGPTESSICATIFKEEFSSLIPIGRPIANAQVYVLDNDRNIVPIGVPGELCIAGAGVARGYLNRPELSAQKFIENPFGPQAKMYCTGDMVQWLSDGNLLFLGRKDDQVKVRGYRIELGEIEHVLSQHKAIKSSCVLAKKDQNNNNRLIGYVVATSPIDTYEIQKYLGAQLPDYMVPAIWTFLDEMPLTSNGKINKKVLPDPAVTMTSKAAYVAPSTEIEKALVTVWKELLVVDTLGIKDNFFELGGDSIITIQLVSRIKRLGYQLKPRDVFDHQTIESLAQFVVNQTEMTQGEQGILSGTSDLLPIQHWYFETLHTAGAPFNQSVLLAVDKSITIAILEEALQLISAYHDALRFSYIKKEENWIQQYTERYCELAIVSVKATPETTTANEITRICNTYQKKITPANTFQAVLLQTPERDGQNRVLLVGHHLVVDGVSWRTILDDFARVITALLSKETIDLGSKGSSYREWSLGLQEFANSPAITNQQHYWKKVISAYNPLPVDINKSYKTRASVRHYTVSLSSTDTTKLLQDVHHLFGTEINDLLLSCLAITITDWTKNKNLVIGMEGHGREEISDRLDISNTAGWFTNLYPVRLEVENAKDLGGVIKSVKEMLRNIPEKGMSYGALKYLHENQEIKEGLSKTSWDIVFNYLGQLDNIIEKDSMIATAEESPGGMVGDSLVFENKIEINGSITQGTLQLNWSYSTAEYKSETIEQIAQQFIKNLQAIIAYCSMHTTREFTPSDYGLQEEINYKELEEFTSFLEEDLSEKGSDILEF